jgi:mannonate dehydratase
MLDGPAREIFEVIRWFGERGKIFNVHFRNIKGRKLDFIEAFPDEGEIDMARALAAYRDVGYPYMLMPDHVPQIDGHDPSGVAFAYCYGYSLRLLLRLHPGAARRAGATDGWWEGLTGSPPPPPAPDTR